MLLLPALERRADEPELMDGGRVEAAELDRALRFLVRCNGLLGGWSALRERLEAWCPRWDRDEPVTFLDVGTGAADIPQRLLRWGRRKGFAVRVTAIDADARVLELARRRVVGEPWLELLHADLRGFAAAGRRFRYVLGSLFLHHVPPAELAATLRLCDGLASDGLLFSDLRRSLGAYAGVAALTLLGGRVTRHDGPLSVRRAFRPEELEAAAAEAGLGYLRARPGPPLRLTLSGEKR